MESSNWDEQLVNYLNGREYQITLFEENDEINLRRFEHSLLLSIQLTRQNLGPKALETWTRLGQASLEHFRGALALEPAGGHLWLLQRLPRDCGQPQLLASLEALLNQRDTWRSLVERLARPALNFNPTSLRPQPY